MLMICIMAINDDGGKNAMGALARHMVRNMVGTIPKTLPHYHQNDDGRLWCGALAWSLQQTGVAGPKRPCKCPY